MRADFQIVYSRDDSDNIKNELLILLKDTLEDKYIERTDEEVKDWIEIKYSHKKDDEFIIGFSLFLDENEKQTEIITGFGKKLRDSDDIHLVLKFLDEDLSEQFKQYSKEIFEIEMKLREIISFIFMDTYRDEYYNLLKEVDVKIQKLNSNDYPNEEYYRSHLENEFFFLVFSDYIRLNNVKEIKHSDLKEAILDSDNYDDFKQKILNRGIVNKKYRVFLAKIKNNLESIENLRNCIAHNRSISDIVRENYERAKDRLKDSIDAFFERNMTKLYLVGKIPWEDADSRGKEGIFETLDNEHIVALLNVEFERAYLPVICEKCGTANLLIAEDIEPVGSEGREMGMEILHSSQAYSICVNCNENMEARITIWEYPDGVFQFFEMDEEENCKHSDTGNLDSLIEDVIRAQEYHEEKNCKHSDIGNLDSLIEDVVWAQEYREEEE